MATTLTKLLTADDLLRLDSEGVRGELIRGVLYETMPAGMEHGEIVMNLGILLGGFIKPRKLGRLTGSDAGVWLERDPDTVREPVSRLYLGGAITAGCESPGLCRGGSRPRGGDCLSQRWSAGGQRQGADVAAVRRVLGVGGAAGYIHGGRVRAGPGGRDAR